MQNSALQIASKVISSYMSNQSLELPKQKKYKVAFFNTNKEKIIGDEIKDVDFTKHFYQKDKSSLFISQAAQMHHGVKYIVLEADSNHTALKEIQYNIIFVSILSITIISLVGFFLGKLFLIPIQNERIRLDKFIKDTTHELNTPLSALVMSVNSLKKENIDKKISDRIDLSAKRINKIYSDLTYMLSSSSNKYIENIDVKDIIENELILYEPLANKKGISVHKNLKSLVVKIDKESLERLVSNLISNAIKYNRASGSLDIIITDNTLVFKDTGIGISKNDLKNIFKRYYRANNYEGGFGIGLDIASRIIQKYNLIIDIKSDINKGTIVKLDFSNIV